MTSTCKVCSARYDGQAWYFDTCPTCDWMRGLITGEELFDALRQQDEHHKALEAERRAAL
jgi:hypothetical protein